MYSLAGENEGFFFQSWSCGISSFLRAAAGSFTLKETEVGEREEVDAGEEGMGDWVGRESWAGAIGKRYEVADGEVEGVEVCREGESEEEESGAGSPAPPDITFLYPLFNDQE